MRNNKVLGVALWAIALLAIHIIIFAIPDAYTPAIWITYGFDLFAFISQLALWLWILRGEVSAAERFLHTPTLTISVAYLLLQFVLSLIFAFVLASAKAAVLVHGFLSIIMCAALVLTFISKNAIERVDKRQKDHHIKL